MGMEVSFFPVCRYCALTFVPKNGMKLLGILFKYLHHAEYIRDLP
jgi:hypothetical protein